MTYSTSARDKSKSPGRHLGYRLENEVGLNPAQSKVTIDIFAQHLSNYCSDRQTDQALQGGTRAPHLLA